MKHTLTILMLLVVPIIGRAKTVTEAIADWGTLANDEFIGISWPTSDPEQAREYAITNLLATYALAADHMAASNLGAEEDSHLFETAASIKVQTNTNIYNDVLVKNFTVSVIETVRDAQSGETAILAKVTPSSSDNSTGVVLSMQWQKQLQSIDDTESLQISLDGAIACKYLLDGKFHENQITVKDEITNAKDSGAKRLNWKVTFNKQKIEGFQIPLPQSTPATQNQKEMCFPVIGDIGISQSRLLIYQSMPLGGHFAYANSTESSAVSGPDGNFSSQTFQAYAEFNLKSTGQYPKHIQLVNISSDRIAYTFPTLRNAQGWEKSVSTNTVPGQWYMLPGSVFTSVTENLSRASATNIASTQSADKMMATLGNTCSGTLYYNIFSKPAVKPGSDDVLEQSGGLFTDVFIKFKE